MMLRLMIKDIYTQKKSTYFIPLIVLVYFIMAAGDRSDQELIDILVYGAGVGFMTYYSVMASNFNTNEGGKTQNRLLLSLPVTRRSAVLAKYLMVVVWWLFAYATSAVIISAFRPILHFQGLQPLDFRVAVLSLCFSCIFSSVFYPFFFKFGYRPASVLGIMSFSAFLGAIGAFFSDTDSPAISGNQALLNFILNHPMILLIIATLIVMFASYIVSAHIFEKKEF